MSYPARAEGLGKYDKLLNSVHQSLNFINSEKIIISLYAPRTDINIFLELSDVIGFHEYIHLFF